MSDIVDQLRQAALTRDDYRWVAADEIERLRQVLENVQQARVLQGKVITDASNEIERLRAALREIAKHPRGGVIDTPEKMDRDEFIGIARAALEGKE